LWTPLDVRQHFAASVFGFAFTVNFYYRFRNDKVVPVSAAVEKAVTDQVEQGNFSSGNSSSSISN
jgi:hypothetical protein